MHDLSSSVAAGKAGGASASVSVSGLRSPVVASEGEAMALLFEVGLCKDVMQQKGP